MPRKAKPPRPVVAPPQPVGPPWFRDICAGYLRTLHRRGRRPRTLRAYLSELRACGHWLEDEAISDAKQLTGAHLELWQDYRAGVVKPGTAKLSAAAVRGALRWAAIQEPPLIAAALWLRVVTARIARSRFLGATLVAGGKGGSQTRSSEKKMSRHLLIP